MSMPGIVPWRRGSARRDVKVVEHFRYDFAILLWNMQRLNFVACAPRWLTCDCGVRKRKSVILNLELRLQREELVFYTACKKHGIAQPDSTWVK